MARGTTPYIGGYGTVSAYKACYQPISQILNQAATRTADTGQVNWASVSTENTTLGRDYEVFAMGGPLQATAPILIRIDYLGGNAGGSVYVTIGTTTDGAGTLGGLLLARVALNSFNITQGNLTGWAACDGSYFTFLYNSLPNGAGWDYPGMFIVERTRDVAGNATASGFHVWRWCRTATSTETFMGGWSKTFGAQTQTAAGDVILGANFPDAYNVNSTWTGRPSRAFPAYTYTLPNVGGASKALLIAIPGDFPRLRPVTLDHYGETQTFIPLADSLQYNLPTLSAANTAAVKAMAPLIRWD